MQAFECMQMICAVYHNIISEHYTSCTVVYGYVSYLIGVKNKRKRPSQYGSSSLRSTVSEESGVIYRHKLHCTLTVIP